MTKCPICRVNAWPATTFGIQACPNCAETFKIRRDGANGQYVELHREITYRTKQRVASRDQTVVNGLVICACCQRPYTPDQTIQGKIDSDGKQRIKRQIGWYLGADGRTFEPAYEVRFIPKTIRGLICIECMNDYGGSQVGKMAQPSQFQKLFDDVRGNGFPVLHDDMAGWLRSNDPQYRDPDPTWAHTGNGSWLVGDGGAMRIRDVGDRSVKMPGLRQAVELPRSGFVKTFVSRSKHPDLCPCATCLHFAWGETTTYDPILHIDRSRHTRPILSVGWLSGSRMGRPLRRLMIGRCALPLIAPGPTVAPLQRRLSALWTAIKCKHGITAPTCALCPSTAITTEPIRVTVAPGISVSRPEPKPAPRSWRYMGPRFAPFSITNG